MREARDANPPLSDADVLKILEEASQQYDRYLELARISDVARVVSAGQARSTRNDLPLSLVIWPDK